MLKCKIQFLYFIGLDKKEFIFHQICNSGPHVHLTSHEMSQIALAKSSCLKIGPYNKAIIQVGRTCLTYPSVQCTTNNVVTCSGSLKNIVPGVQKSDLGQTSFYIYIPMWKSYVFTTWDLQNYKKFLEITLWKSLCSIPDKKHCLP